MLADEIENCFENAKDHVVIACEYLEDLVSFYRDSGLPEKVKAARYEKLRAKIDYLKGIHLNHYAHPWAEDKE